MASGQRCWVTALLLLVLFCPGTEGCGWNTTALTGTVHSPNFPNNVTNNLTCDYVITAPVGHQITLTFTDFALDPRSTCSFDYVKIWDGDETSPLIGVYCGDSLPAPRRTFGNQMWIKFVTDGNSTGAGFKADFSTDLQAPYFMITSSAPYTKVGGAISRMDVQTLTNYTIPVNYTLYKPSAMDYDPVGQTMYWSELGLHRGIRGSALDGTGRHTVLDTGNTSLVEGLAVDPASRLLFYTDRGRDLIAMVTLYTSRQKTIIDRDLDKPYAIVLHTVNGVMFWTDWGLSPKIERANYDGTDRLTLVSKDLTMPNGLALDVSNNRLYWVDAFTDRVERVDLNGTKRQVLLSLSDKSNFMGLALLNGNLYFTDWVIGSKPASSRLHRLCLMTGSHDILVSIDGHVDDIHVYDPQRPARDYVNGCGRYNGGCAVFCIPLPGNSRKCMCPEGQRCVDRPPPPSPPAQCDQPNIPVIVGGTAAGVVVIVAVVNIVICIVCKKKLCIGRGPGQARDSQDAGRAKPNYSRLGTAPVPARPRLPGTAPPLPPACFSNETFDPDLPEQLFPAEMDRSDYEIA